MNVLLMTIFLAVAVFAAIALIIFMAVGDHTPAEVRLAQLQSARLGTEESDVWESFRGARLIFCGDTPVGAVPRLVALARR